jgi:hypothetical protein
MKRAEPGDSHLIISEWEGAWQFPVRRGWFLSQSMVNLRCNILLSPELSLNLAYLTFTCVYCPPGLGLNTTWPRPTLFLLGAYSFLFFQEAFATVFAICVSVQETQGSELFWTWVSLEHLSTTVLITMIFHNFYLLPFFILCYLKQLS